MPQKKNQNKPVVITLDGPAGAGKSTVAKGLANRLGYSFLDTGAMYRALTFKAIQNNVDLENEDQLVALAKKTTIELQGTPDGLIVLLDGQDVSSEIRLPEITNKTFYAARAPKVREILVEWQRKIAGTKNVVAEGRDTGSVVFPEATFKFYLDASVEERLRRRLEELQAKGEKVDADQLYQEIKDRDQRDMNREVGPLVKADDAVVIDSTKYSIDDTVEVLINIIKSKSEVSQ